MSLVFVTVYAFRRDTEAGNKFPDAHLHNKKMRQLTFEKQLPHPLLGYPDSNQERQDQNL